MFCRWRSTTRLLRLPTEHLQNSKKCSGCNRLPTANAVNFFEQDSDIASYFTHVVIVMEWQAMRRWMKRHWRIVIRFVSNRPWQKKRKCCGQTFKTSQENCNLKPGPWWTQDIWETFADMRAVKSSIARRVAAMSFSVCPNSHTDSKEWELGNEILLRSNEMCIKRRLDICSGSQ